MKKIKQVHIFLTVQQELLLFAVPFGVVVIDGTGKVFSLPVPVPVKIIGPDRTGR